MDRTPRVCNSAGHGKNSRTPGAVDPGAEVIGPGTEADYTLDIIRRLDADYEALGVWSMMVDAAAYHRADDIAAHNRCDTLDEFHTNATSLRPKKDGKEVGVEVLYEDPKDEPYAMRMSAAIAKASGLPNRGAKRRTDLAVLNPRAGMRQVIVELMFGSDADDVAAYNAHKTDVENAIVNVNLKTWGWRPYTFDTPPRNWSGWRKRWYRARRFT